MESTEILHERLLNGNQLLEMEKIIQRYVLRHPELNLMIPHNEEELAPVWEDLTEITRRPDIINHVRQSHRAEKDFFETDENMNIISHYRFLPAQWHMLYFPEILCAVRGNCTIYFNDRQVTMTTGDVLIIAPKIMHAVSVFEEDSLLIKMGMRTSTFEKSFFGVLDGDDVISLFFQNMLYNNLQYPYLYFNCEYDSDMIEFLLKAQGEFVRRRRFRRRMLNNYAMSFFIMLLRNHETDYVSPKTTNAQYNSNVIFILQYIQEHYNTVSLPELARFFNYSERQIQRVIKDHTGKSYRELVQDNRMKQAIRMLNETDYNMQEISSTLGYSDEGSFRNLFRKTYGMTPNEYRAANKNT